MKAIWTTGLAGALAIGALAACSDDDTDGAAAGAGGGATMSYFAGVQSQALGAANNQADCALCHSTDGTTAGLSGSTMMDIAYRTSFKGGMMLDLLGATNACVTGWMGGAALTATDPAWLSLQAYMQSLSNPAVTTPTTLAPQVLMDQAAYEAAYAGGNAAAGQAKFASFCGGCHTAGLVVGPAPSPGVAFLATVSVGRLAQKARTSGPPPSSMSDMQAGTDTTPGPMPFFEPDELPDTDLSDIIAYIKSEAP